MAKFIVRRSTYRELPQDSLASFADNVFTRMSSLPEYQPFATEVAQLGQQLEQYKEALSKAVYGGVDRIAVKNEKKQQLLLSLDRIADLLNASYTGVDSWIVGAGMETMRGPAGANGLLDAPFDLRAFSRDESGEVILSFNLPNPGRVRNNAIEYSVDGGASWKNGQYSTATRIRLKDLPARQEVKFRVRSLGAAMRQSPWSKPVDVFVV